MTLPVAIVIPTLDRPAQTRQAVAAALGQSHPDAVVIVVDDGSLAPVADALVPDPRLSVVTLARNLGTAQAKNAGLLLAGDRAVTFHDSDDLPHRDKVLRQARVMAQEGIGADPCLNWALAGHAPGATLSIGAVLAHHDLILPDGRRVTVRRPISLVDDVFPNLQMGTTVPGDWMHVNSGLFAPAVFARLGGFSDCIEEDREFRNRLILGGEIVWVIEDVLMTKIETPGALTQAADTDYASDRRARDRARVWAGVERWLSTRWVAPEPIDLPDGAIAAVTNPGVLVRSGALATPATVAMIDAALAGAGR